MYIETGDFKVIQLTYTCKVSLLITACCIDLQDDKPLAVTVKTIG